MRHWGPKGSTARAPWAFQDALGISPGDTLGLLMDLDFPGGELARVMSRVAEAGRVTHHTEGV